MQNIRERTYGGKRARVLDNKLPNHSRAKYGYQFADDPGGSSHDRKTHYVPDPDAAPVVVRIHQMYYDGLKMRVIRQRLTQDGVPTPTQLWEARGMLPKNRRAAVLWRTSTIADIIRDTAYIGKLVGWRTTRTTVVRVDPITGESIEYIGYRERDAEDTDRIEYGSDVCPPLVDEAIFRANQETMKRNKELSTRNMRERKQALLRNGIGTCGYCGRNIQAHFVSADKCYRYYCGGSNHEDGCPGGNWSWRTQEIGDWVWQFFMCQFDDPDVLQMNYTIWKAERVSGRSSKHDELEAVEEQLTIALRRAKNARTTSLDAEADEDRAEWARIAIDEKAKARELTIKREALIESIELFEEEEDAVLSLVSLDIDAKERLRSADFDSRRRFLHAFKVCVRLKGKREAPSDQQDFSWELGAVYNHWVQGQLELPVQFSVRSQQ